MSRMPIDDAAHDGYLNDPFYTRNPLGNGDLAICESCACSVLAETMVVMRCPDGRRELVCEPCADDIRLTELTGDPT